jgi:single-strand DNA-binding protein
MNKVILLGNVVKDAEIVSTKTGVQITKFTVATNTYTNQEQRTEYHDCLAFDKTGETIHKFFPKGKPIYVEGRLQTRSWEQDGIKKYRTEIVVDKFSFVPTPPPVGKEIRPTAEKKKADEDFDNLPF